ncbi:MAG: NYN domain-containing protein, partial [Proteobacteria bacterium]|nr:NYN domain-containing protein [Pseudomonadota bacterium]
ATYKADRGFGFMRYHLLTGLGLETRTVFFHCSKSAYENDPQVFTTHGNIFEFQIGPTSKDATKLEAVNIRLFNDEDFR